MKKPYKPGPNKLPLTPWWYHPNHRYEGRHRGTYRFRTGDILEFGVRSIMVRPYVFGEGETLTVLSDGFLPIGFMSGDPELDPIPGDEKVVRTYVKREVRIDLP